MRVAYSQVLNENMPLQAQINVLQGEINKIFTCLQGRISFGIGTTGINGQNISGQWVTYTSNGAANTEDTIAHTIGSIPLGYLVVSQNKAGTIYQQAGTGTAWTSSNIYVKCNVASVAFLLFLVKKGATS